MKRKMILIAAIVTLGILSVKDADSDVTIANTGIPISTGITAIVVILGLIGVLVIKRDLDEY